MIQSTENVEFFVSYLADTINVLIKGKFIANSYT